MRMMCTLQACAEQREAQLGQTLKPQERGARRARALGSTAMSGLGAGSGARPPSSGRRTVVKQMLYSCARSACRLEQLHACREQAHYGMHLPRLQSIHEPRRSCQAHSCDRMTSAAAVLHVMKLRTSKARLVEGRVCCRPMCREARLNGGGVDRGGAHPQASLRLPGRAPT